MRMTKRRTKELEKLAAATVGVVTPELETGIDPAKTAAFPEVAVSDVRVTCPVCETSYALHRLGLEPGTEPQFTPTWFQRTVLRRKASLTHLSATQVR